MSYLSTDKENNIFQEVLDRRKRELGRFNIKEFTTSNGFDKSKFSYKCKCGYCNKFFNPFEEASLEVKSEWEWSLDGKEAQKIYTVICRYCKNALQFSLFTVKEYI